MKTDLVFFTRTCGAFMCNQEIPGITHEVTNKDWYGSTHFIGESMSVETMRNLAKLLGGRFEEQKEAK